MVINFDLFPVNTQIFAQIPGVRFPTTPRVIRPALGDGLAVSNAQPGEEFNNQPLIIEFSAPQRVVALFVGVNSSSPVIQATLSGFDQSGVVVAQNGPIGIQGPMPIEIFMVIDTPQPVITRVELQYSHGFAEVVKNVTFETVGTDKPTDRQAPGVIIVQPFENMQLTGETFTLEARIIEERKLKSVSVTVSNDAGTTTFDVSFGGKPPNHKIGPTTTGFLAPGANRITVHAEDFAGNIGESSVNVSRVPLAGRLVVNPTPIIASRRNATTVQVDLQETSPGSLSGRKDILILASTPASVAGMAHIRDPLNQVDTHAELAIVPPFGQRLGKTSIKIQAIEVESQFVIDTLEIPASITIPTPVECPGGVPLFEEIRLDFVSDDEPGLVKQLNDAIDKKLEGRLDLQKINDMTVIYGQGVLKVAQRYNAKQTSGIAWTAPVNFYAELKPRVVAVTGSSPTIFQIVFEYVVYDAHANPYLPTGLAVVPVLSIFAHVGWDVVKGKMEREFTANFKDSFKNDLQNQFNERINEANPFAPRFLKDVFINPSEFALVFCIPANFFDTV